MKMLNLRHFLKLKSNFQLVRKNQGTLAAAAIQQNSSPSSSVLQQKSSNEEYTEKPEYPEILDISYEARKERKKQIWYDEIKNLQTIEEKLLKINMPRYYGYKTIALKDNIFPYNCLPLTQHYTRTLFEEIDKLPSDYYKSTKNIDTFVEYFTPDIKDAIEFSIDVYKHNHSKENLEPSESDKILGEIIVNQLNRVLLNLLMDDCNHLNDIEIDIYPRHEAFWFVGGVNPSKSAQRMRKGCEWTKKYVDEPYDRPVQYIGKQLI